MEFTSSMATARFAPDQGGRLASLQVLGRELLVTSAEHPLHWGSYPMAPWAGRVRHGRFRHNGTEYRLPLTLPPHAIHGTAWGGRWQQHCENGMFKDLGDDWPFAGRAEQYISLSDHMLTMELSVHAHEDSFPASIGWHPWFLREVGDASAELLFDAAAIYVDDREQIPTGELASPPPGPWDNCFTQLRSDPRIRWPGMLQLTLSSDLDNWVVYDLPEHALCVEPMSGPPNALNLQPRLVTPEQPLRGTFTLTWTEEDAG